MHAKVGGKRLGVEKKSHCLCYKNGKVGKNPLFFSTRYWVLQIQRPTSNRQPSFDKYIEISHFYKG